MKVELLDPLINIFPDSKVSSKPSRRLSLDVPRGGTVAFHLLINRIEEPGKISVRIIRGGRTARANLFRLIDVPVEVNTGPVGSTEGPKEKNKWVIRRAPFRVYDAMQPVKSPMIAETSTLALRGHISIPRNARARKAAYTIEVTSGSEKRRFTLDVRVHNVVLPRTGKDSFPYTSWFHLDQMASRHRLPMWGEAHWRMIRRYADLMYHSRQNTFMITLSDVFDVVGKKPVLNRKRLRRIVNVFTKAGLHCIEGGHIARRPRGDWNSKTLDIILTGTQATALDGNSDLAAITGQLMDEIDRNGWRDRWIQHVSDEPTDVNSSEYRILVGMVRKYMPGIPILDATMNPDLVGSVDIWCPQPHKYEEHRAKFERNRSLGDKVWYYTCCYPGCPWLNRLLDMELIRPALLGWAAARYQLDGFLHWGFSRWRPEQDPFERSVVNPSGNFELPPGDTHIAYPGKDGPWSSLRLEAQREGFEDMDLLTILGRHKPEARDRIVSMVLKSFSKYAKEVKRFREARRALLKALARHS